MIFEMIDFEVDHFPNWLTFDGSVFQVALFRFDLSDRFRSDRFSEVTHFRSDPIFEVIDFEVNPFPKCQMFPNELFDFSYELSNIYR